MANDPTASPLGDSSSAGGAGFGSAAPTPLGPTHNPASAAHHMSLSWIKRLIRGLDYEETREQSLDLLCKNVGNIGGTAGVVSNGGSMAETVKIERCKSVGQCGWNSKSENRQACDGLAVLLWNTFGTMKLLLQEITSIYRPLLSNSLSDRSVTQVCNAIALLQSVASHPDTRVPFVKASIPVYLYPFLNTTNRDWNSECLRLTSLGVIGSLAKVDDAEVVDYLLFTQIFPSCLRCMEVGRTLSKTVATFIIYNILLKEKGMTYCFTLAERYLVVSHALAKMVERLAEEDERTVPRLLRNIIGCYLRLSENERTRKQLSTYIPSKLVDNSYINILQGDAEALANLQQLICNLRTGQRNRTQPTGESLGPFFR
ncbi:hypothetical protein DITRI_Ditri11bG0037700 [Diplodiscus trichospermus]